jgi:hypothetical protein
MPPSEPPHPEHPVPGKPKRRRHILWKAVLLSRARRRWRWAFRLMIVIPLTLIAAAIVLTHSPLTRMLILPAVGAASGLTVDADSVHISRDGTVVMDRAVFSIPGVPGEPGRFLRIARVEADMDWWRTATGRPMVTAVRMIDPVLVVSQSTEDGSLNIGSVPVPAGRPGGMELPGILATNVGLELGEHGKNGYRTLKRIRMDGSLVPVKGQPGLYAVELTETHRWRRRGPGTGFTLGGNVSDGTIDLKLQNFSLSDWQSSTLPASIREISDNLALSGEVSSARFLYTDADGITASMDLKNMAMNLPLEAGVQGPVYQPEGEPAPVRYMRMSGVNGTITFARDSVVAKVGGVIEDLPYEVHLRYHGVDEDSPFEMEFVSRDFHMSSNPELLLFAPPVVKYYLKAFLMPTGIVTTNVHITRGAAVPGTSPPQSGPISVSGSIDFREGTAAYETFPYEFNDMTGRFEFDNNQIRVVSVTGQSKTGARLHASGRIGPLDETSEVDIHVAVSDAQIDEAMEAAFGPDRGAVIAALFNESRHQQLVDAGLIRTPEQAAAEEREILGLAERAETDPEAAHRLKELQTRSGIAVFPFRGTADVAVHVYSPRGLNEPYRTNVDVFLPRIGLVPDKFPYPVIAENVSVEVRNQQGRIAFGSFRGLHGGRADVLADFTVPGKADGPSGASPRIEIRASEMPVDALLFHALPGEPDSATKRIIRDLRVRAVASGVVRIASRRTPEDGDEEPTGFDVDIAISGGEAHPAAYGEDGAGRVALAEIAGRLEANENELFLDLEAEPVALGAAAAPEVGPVPPISESPRVGGTLTVHIDGKFPASESDPEFFVWSSCPAFDLASPVESLIGVFSADAAASLARMRDAYHPSGFVNVRTEALTGSGETTVKVAMSGARSLGAEFLGAQAVIPDTEGRMELEVGGGGKSVARFKGVSGGLFYAGERAGFVSLEGELPIGAGSADTGSLEVALLDGRLECELTRRIVDQLDTPAQPGGEQTPSVYAKFNPVGEFDARIVLSPAAGGGVGVDNQGRYQVKGKIEPRTLSLRTGSVPVEFSSVGGLVEFEPGSGVLRGLRLQAPEWTVQADGAWSLASDGKVVFATNLTARGNKLSEDLTALLPIELSDLFRDLNLKIAGPFQLSDSHLDITRGGATPPAARFSGRLDFVDAGLEAGVPISNMSGAVLVQFDSTPRPATVEKAGQPGPSFRLDTRAHELQVAGVTLTGGVARIESGDSVGHVRVREASGMCHGGRFHVRAEVVPESVEPGAQRSFNAQFQLAGVRFSTLLRELVDSVKPFVGPPAPADVEMSVAERNALQRARRDEFSRGLLDAELTIEGPLSDPDGAGRRGRGTVRVSGGRVLNLPVMTGLIEALNFQLPFNSSLDYAWASIFIEGPVITFEDLSVQSAAVEISGGGTMTWPDRELDLRLQTRSIRPIPLLTDIIQGIRHQFLETRVTGKLGEQVVGLQSPGPTRMLDNVLERGVQDQRPLGADRQRDRSRKRGIRPVSGSSQSTEERAEVEPQQP